MFGCLSKKEKTFLHNKMFEEEQEKNRRKDEEFISRLLAYHWHYHRDYLLASGKLYEDPTLTELKEFLIENSLQALRYAGKYGDD